MVCLCSSGLWGEGTGPGCAFKLFPTQALKHLNLQSKGAFINAEILSELKGQGMSWKEIPVTHYPRLEGVQTGANPKVVLRLLKRVGSIIANDKDFL